MAGGPKSDLAQAFDMKERPRLLRHARQRPDAPALIQGGLVLFERDALRSPA